MSKIIDGKKISNEIKEELKEKVSKMSLNIQNNVQNNQVAFYGSRAGKVNFRKVQVGIQEATRIREKKLMAMSEEERKAFLKKEALEREWRDCSKVYKVESPLEALLLRLQTLFK